MNRSNFDMTDERRMHAPSLAAFPATGEPAWLQQKPRHDAEFARFRAEATAFDAASGDHYRPLITRLAAHAARTVAALIPHRPQTQEPKENHSVSKPI